MPHPQHTSVTPALDDSEEESTIASPPPGLPSPPTSAPAKPMSETVSLVSSSPVFRLPTRWSEQDRHTYLSVSADGRELTYHGKYLSFFDKFHSYRVLSGGNFQSTMLTTLQMYFPDSL